MSKRNMLLGLAAGKLGDLVFYRAGGEQRHRPHVIPNNPRSQAQMAQRVRIANVSATYRLLKSIIAESFTGRPSNQSGYNAFASGAINISPFLTREMSLADVCMPAPYVIARGAIAPLSVNFTQANSALNLGVSVAGITAEDNTIAKVSAALLKEYSQLQQGDILTFVSIGYVPAWVGDTQIGYRGVPSTLSMKIDTTNTSALPSNRLKAIEGVFNFTAWEQNDFAAAAVVVSRVDGNGSLQTSFTELVLSSEAESLYSDYREESALFKAVESYNVGEQSILRD